MPGTQGWRLRGRRWGLGRPAGAKSWEALTGLGEVLKL